MKKILLSNFTVGLVLTLLTLYAFFFNISFFQSIEFKTYDLRAELRQNPKPSDTIAIVTIDDDSIAKLGRWPWPRTLIADGIKKISDAGAKVIALSILFTEPERNQGLIEIQNLEDELSQLIDETEIKIKQQKQVQQIKDDLKNKLSVILSSAQVRLDNDTKLIDAIEQAKTVVLPMFFSIGQALSEDTEPVLSSHTITAILNTESKTDFLVEGNSPVVPLEDFSDVSPAVGHVNLIPDIDGVIRSEIPVIQFQGEAYMSFAAQIVREYLNVPIESVKLTVGKSVQIGKAIIPIDSEGKMLINYNGPVGTFKYYSFYDVINDKIDPAALKNKIVILGHMATGIADLHNTPIGPSFPSIDITANVIDNILGQNFITRPKWANNAELGSIIFIGLFISLLLPRLKALIGALISIFLFAAIAGSGVYFFVNNGYWLKVFYPIFLLLCGYLLIVSKRFLVTEKKKELVEASAIETNRMLGLSFQGQGMLDMAFDKFRKCPIDDQMKELLYNLALDFERKRQFNKAAAVYEHIMAVDPKYKGIDERIKQLKAAADGAVFGGLSPKKSGGAEGTVILDASSATVPTLGRYEIMKELGHGAMGTVYLGKDPKINRQVAIKTLHFDDDVDEATTKATKERFFREAESAGNLNHPNIIKIYDAGEDNEISYIAMELLEGSDLKKYTNKDSLLPIETTIDYMAKCADALDFAHQQGVIHRDIKPANIMLLKDGTIRITDFGIARITASSKTQTGTVLGTPSYMSPEQLSGKKVDGRSDLFSLGVTLYELLLGEKPFEGDSIATLLYKIGNEKHPDPKVKNPALSGSLVKIIDKMLEKDPDKRYQHGKEIAEDLKKCLTEQKFKPV